MSPMLIHSWSYNFHSHFFSTGAKCSANINATVELLQDTLDYERAEFEGLLQHKRREIEERDRIVSPPFLYPNAYRFPFLLPFSSENIQLLETTRKGAKHERGQKWGAIWKASSHWSSHSTLFPRPYSRLGQATRMNNSDFTKSNLYMLSFSASPAY